MEDSVYLILVMISFYLEMTWRPPWGKVVDKLAVDRLAIVNLAVDKLAIEKWDVGKLAVVKLGVEKSAVWYMSCRTFKMYYSPRKKYPPACSFML